MNQREIEKEIWRSLLVVVENFEDFDSTTHIQLITENYNRYSRAIDRVAELIAKKVD